MAFNSYAALIVEGPLADRPTTPEISALRQFFYATDTGALYLWSPTNVAWTLLQASSVVVDAGVTASATQTIAGATQLTGTYNDVTVVATASNAVGLPPLTAIGQQVFVSNAGANAMKVFPAAGDTAKTIDGGSAGASVTVTNAKSAMFTATTLTNWQSIGFATRSA